MIYFLKNQAATVYHEAVTLQMVINDHLLIEEASVEYGTVPIKENSKKWQQSSSN